MLKNNSGNMGKIQTQNFLQQQQHHHGQSSSATQHKNVINSIMSFLPDNRPITSLQIVEDYEKCPKNFQPIYRTYDQDSDADLWRETNILFGKQTSRYLCLSKSEGLPEYVVETLKIIGEKEIPPKEFSLLSRTADTEQRAWRKRQIAYKLSRRGAVSFAITDIILCAKLKQAPEGFTLAGELNGILVCYKAELVHPLRQPPSTPKSITNDLETSLNRLNLSGGKKLNQPLPPVPTDHDYEEIKSTYQLSPKRPAPKPPIIASSSHHHLTAAGTLGAYSEIEGVPLVLNSNLSNNDLQVPTLKLPILTSDLDYDFQLERQILCTIKSTKPISSSNPFFK